MKTLRIAMLLGLAVSLAGVAPAQQAGKAEGIPGFLNPKTHTFHTKVVPQSAPATATPKTYAGELKFAFAVTLGTPLTSGETLVCIANADVADGEDETFYNSYEEEASVTATVSGSTANCYVNIHYSWSLYDGPTDSVSLSYELVVLPSSTSLVEFLKRDHSGTIAPILVPVTGTTTNLSVSATI